MSGLVKYSLQKQQSSTAWRAASAQKKPVMHTLTWQSVTKINLALPVV